MNELDFQNLSTVQSKVQPKPVTIASSTTIAPTTFLSFISGTTAIATVTPPLPDSVHMLCFIFTTTTPTAFTTAGNIKIITTPTANLPFFLVYDPLTAKYYTGEVTV